MRPTTFAMVLLSLVGCATADNIDTREPENLQKEEAAEPSPPPPPPPKGFFCTADPARAEAAVCARTQESCDELRGQLTQKGAAPAACASAATAVCFSAAKVDEITQTDLCFPTRDACQAQHDLKAKREDYGQVGECRDET